LDRLPGLPFARWKRHASPRTTSPPELVLETIASLVAVDYPAMRVQIIDDNITDPALWQPVEAE